MITKFKIFEEYRLSDNVKIIGSGFTYSVSDEFDERDFLKYITFRSIYEKSEKTRYRIYWNHVLLTHDLIEKIKEETSLKNTSEFKTLVKNFLNELFNDYYFEITKNGNYSLWLSEYNISFIININHKNKKLFFVTFFKGMVSNNVRNVIELKSII